MSDVDLSSREQCTAAGRVYLASRCISVHPNSSRTWYGARRACVDAGGDVLSVDDDSLLRTLANYINNWLSPPTRWWIDGVTELWHWPHGISSRTL